MNQGMTLASRRTEVCHDDPSVIEFCPARPCRPVAAHRNRQNAPALPFRSLTGGGTIRSSGQPAVGGEARRRAAVILEVLAGVHTPTSAAQALGIGAQRYYLLEQQALEGLVQACQPRPHGRTVTSDRQIARLERELAVCRRELGRQQAPGRGARSVSWG